MQATAYGTTNIGRRRDRNEDAFLIDEQFNLFIVCDGIGGHAAGEIASQKTTEFVAEYLRDNESARREAHASPGGYFRVVELAETATVDSCRRLHELASSESDCAGMGTTMTMLLLVDNKGIMSHVGDSRLYLLRDDELHRLSSDHTLANEMLQRGLLQPEEFDACPYQHVLTRSVGSVPAVESDMLLFDILPNDTFLLCSDGLTKYIEDDELIGFLQTEDLSGTADELIELANRRGGKDNITVVLVRSTADHSDQAEAEETRLKVEALQPSFLCNGVSYSRLVRLVEISEIRQYDAGARVLAVDDPCDGLHLIVSGRIAISRDGNESIELTTGDCFCETALVRKRQSHASADAKEPTTLVVVPRTDFQRFTRRFPKIGRILHARLLEHLARQIDDARDSA